MAFQILSKARHNSRRSFILHIHEHESKKTWLEAYRNSCLHFIDPWAASCTYIHVTVYTLPYQSSAIPYYLDWIAHAHQDISKYINLIALASCTIDSIYGCTNSRFLPDVPWRSWYLVLVTAIILRSLIMDPSHQRTTSIRTLAMARIEITILMHVFYF